jgi:hypothetical protein
MVGRAALFALAAAGCAAADGEEPAKPWKALETGEFAWRASAPLLAGDPSGDDPLVALKDPSFVRVGSRWHLFATARMRSGKVDIAYLSFDDWSQAARAPRTLLHLHDRYHGAPQVFWFAQEKRWYLVFQLADDKRTPPFQPCFSTTETIGDPASWSKPRPLLDRVPEKPKWLDFWVICDDARAHLFWTSLDGRMWRASTRREDFPDKGWSAPEIALEADLFEASHTYRLRGTTTYLTIAEAQGDRRRYYKAWTADALAGPWKPLADTAAKPFAGAANVRQETPWTANVSHGELVRAGTDERMEVDPADIRFVFQGASDEEYRNNAYGAIPWRIGMLEPAR